MIADALLEAICRASIPGRHHRVFAALIRLTYGYGKRSDRIATSQISALTGIDRRSVTRVLQDLEAAGMVARGPFERGRSRRLAIVKDFDRWELGPTSEVSPATGCSDLTNGADDPTCGDSTDGRDAPCVDPPTGVAATGGVAQETPLVGSSTPPTIEKETITRETGSAGAAAPSSPRISNSRSGKKTRCPEKLDPEDRARVKAWRDADYAADFSNRELAAQWVRFYDWHHGRETLDPNWPSRFQFWLTSEKFSPLAAAEPDPSVAPVTYFTASREPLPEWDAAAWERTLQECNEIRARHRLTRKVAPVRLPTSRDRVVAR